jgi:hypothetical protein
MAYLRIASACIAFAGAALLSGTAHSQNLLANGSFEAGVGSWTLVESAPGACVFDSLVHPGNSTGFAAFPTQPPAQGARVLVSDANAPATCTFFQDVVVASANNRLTYSAGYNYLDAGGDPLGVGCSANVDVTDTGGVLIAAGYSATGGTNQAMAVRPPINFTVAPGSTVRVAITTVACAGGPAGIVADNFVLAAAGAVAVPTLAQWALLLLALLMLALAAPRLRRAVR